jgi:hypothetical protein
MTTTVPSAALATIQPARTDPERLALAGYRRPGHLVEGDGSRKTAALWITASIRPVWFT